MMKIVRIKGWHPGLQKVSMTETIQRFIGLNLRRSKDITDRVLEGESIDFEIPDLKHAEIFVQELQAIGAIAEVL